MLRRWFGSQTPPSPADDLDPGAAPAGFREAMAQTRDALLGPLNAWFSSGRTVDASFFDDLEETLIRADVGLDLAVSLVERLRTRRPPLATPEAIREALKDEFLSVLSPAGGFTQAFTPVSGQMNIVLVVGVNGSGKTTFLGKYAHRLRESGQRVLLGAGDTFRAAAEEQLSVWAERADVPIVRRDGADPAAVVFETVQQAQAEGVDWVLLDTAGRLQSKFNLMEELRKVRRSIDKALGDAPQAAVHSLLVLDATMGQNALRQAEVFNEAVTLNGVVLTKLDGTAKGGIVLAIAQTYGLPVVMAGVGERIEDLRDFDARAFVDALCG